MIKRKILGINFLCGSVSEVIRSGLAGGLVVVPSAPVLVRMTDDEAHRESLLKADHAITDSGLMVLLWRLFKGEKLERVSGLEYLKLLLEKLAPSSQPLAPSSVLWVMPTAAARDRNLAWLQSAGHRTSVEDCYLAPHYAPIGPLADQRLLDWVCARQPQHIIIALGGGVQERLGYFLKQGLERLAAKGSQSAATGHQLPATSSYKPGIHCVGAAIGFLSGEQVRIPMWADYLYLGWFWRILSAPTKFFPRYWKATRLVALMWRYREKAPPVGPA